MKRKYSAVVALILSLTLLASCGESTGTQETAPPEGVAPGVELGAASMADKVFSLNSSSADGFNPYVTLNADNLLVSQLVYENIYELDDDYNLSSRVITKASTADGQYWYFTVSTDIIMHDGEPLTATDVAYSIQLAARSRRFGSRLSNVWGASATGSDTFAVSLAKPNTQLPMLLNIPIVRYGSYGEALPAGSGPYKFSADGTYLEIFDGYSAEGTPPFDRVYLREYTLAEDIISAFEDSYIDLVVNDPSGSSDLGYGGNTEKRHYTTTNMHFLGFNLEGDFVKSIGVRNALQRAVDRSYAAETLLKGTAIASALPVSPKSPLYDRAFASTLSYDMDAVSLMLYNSNVRDFDNDGKLEYLETGIPLEMELDLIVCGDAAGKADIAKKLADDLGELGLKVNVRELSWGDYTKALDDGDFDIYYGEIKLNADFDLTPLFSEDSSVNYCSVEDDLLTGYIDEYLAATEDKRQEACASMLQYLTNCAYIVPICFERQEVITHRSVISGMSPNSGNVFCGIYNWKISFEEDNND